MIPRKGQNIYEICAHPSTISTSRYCLDMDNNMSCADELILWIDTLFTSQMIDGFNRLGRKSQACCALSHELV